MQTRQHGMHNMDKQKSNFAILLLLLFFVVCIQWILRIPGAVYSTHSISLPTNQFHLSSPNLFSTKAVPAKGLCTDLSIMTSFV